MDGGGGSKTTSTQSSDYPPEFRPLAKSAVEQIQAMQQQLPLAMFTGYQPAGTAGLAPLQQFAIDNLIPATMRPTAGLQGQAATPGAVSAAAYGATSAGGPTQAENAALATLNNRLAQPAGRLPSTQGLQAYFASQLPGNYNIDSAFPGLSPQTINGLGDMSSRPTPILGGPGVTSVNPTQPGSFPDPYASLRPPVNQNQSILRLQLSPEEGKLFDGYVAQGKSLEDSFKLVMNKRVAELSRLAPLPPPPDVPPAPTVG